MGVLAGGGACNYLKTIAFNMILKTATARVASYATCEALHRCHCVRFWSTTTLALLTRPLSCVISPVFSRHGATNCLSFQHSTRAANRTHLPVRVCNGLQKL